MRTACAFNPVSARQKIGAYDPGRHAQYAPVAPEGLWIGRLDDLAWGKSSNLFCFFTDEATGQKHRLSVFHRQDYRPYQTGPEFDKEERGRRFEIRTDPGREGLPKFFSARRL